MEVSGETSWMDNDSQSGEEQYGSDDDEERLVVNPVSVRSRIDVCIAMILFNKIIPVFRVPLKF